MSTSQLTETEYVRRQKLIIAIVIALALVFVMLRINLHPGYSDEGFQPFYDDLCHVLKDEGDGNDLFRRAKKEDRKSTRLNSSHVAISYAVFCLKKKIY